jgi:hypothetical protein
MAHALMTPALIAPASMAGSTCTTFSYKLILHTRHLHKHNQAGRKEKPGHSDDGQEVDGEQELDGVQEVNGG